MKVTLKKIKKIKKLEFDIPNRGVWLLTGVNGAGKTSLLAALYRIGSSHAFQNYYRTSTFESRLDSFEQSQVIYEVNGQSVTYKYGGQRWRPTPSRNSRLFGQFPFESVKFVEANGDRVEPFANEIQPRRVRSANESITQFMSYVLADNKWESLKYVNTQRGRGSQAYLLPYTRGGQRYFYSEKNFSLGELCILRLACKLDNIENNSLVLIDEIEMALHPQAQVRLLEKVTEIARNKRLTIIFSTHSATLIKNVSRKNIIFLKEESSQVFKSVSDVYPAQVLGEVAFDDELTTDFILLVEDKQAKNLLEQMLGYYLSKTSSQRNYNPLYKVVPIGGFVQVIDLLNVSTQIFPDYVKRFCFLDEDVKSESLVHARRNNMYSLLTKFEQSQEQIKYLPCTPEVGLMEMVEQADQQLLDRIQGLFEGSVVNLQRIVSSREYLQFNKENIRDKAKDRMDYLVRAIHATTGTSEREIYKALYRTYCSVKYDGSAMPQLHRLLGPILNSR
ncbi:AAA family ATPase [Vibrio parahaemolyticus]|uniref:AAA family ATPase n=1 Tax=Vibrio parahaemolyticus TaxID=670 RepID=UPI00111E2EC1|nr:AAA family ATPase [Vibrio parahaemolyticus]TOI48277.1 ATP-binding protein [Vibrio parahaemolyticus]HCH5323594.1 ATP-binding protein [Vibrio parahaemolyticus]